MLPSLAEPWSLVRRVPRLHIAISATLLLLCFFPFLGFERTPVSSRQCLNSAGETVDLPHWRCAIEALPMMADTTVIEVSPTTRLGALLRHVQTTYFLILPQPSDVRLYPRLADLPTLMNRFLRLRTQLRSGEESGSGSVSSADDIIALSGWLPDHELISVGVQHESRTLWVNSSARLPGCMPTDWVGLPLVGHTDAWRAADPDDLLVDLHHLNYLAFFWDVVLRSKLNTGGPHGPGRVYSCSDIGTTAAFDVVGGRASHMAHLTPLPITKLFEEHSPLPERLGPLLKLAEKHGFWRILYRTREGLLYVLWTGCSRAKALCGSGWNESERRLKRVDANVAPCCVDRLRATLAAASDLLTVRGISHWLMYGSLIGMLRSGDIIPWDHDVDLGVPWAEYESLLDATSGFAQQAEHAGLFHAALWDNFSRLVYDSTTWLPVAGGVGSLHLPSYTIQLLSPFVHDPPQVDLYSFLRAELPITDRDGGRVWNDFSLNLFNFSEADLFPLQLASFVGLDIAVPARPANVLREVYGTKWTTPNHVWMCATRRTPGRGDVVELCDWHPLDPAADSTHSSKVELLGGKATNDTRDTPRQPPPAHPAAPPTSAKTTNNKQTAMT